MSTLFFLIFFMSSNLTLTEKTVDSNQELAEFYKKLMSFYEELEEKYPTELQKLFDFNHNENNFHDCIIQQQEFTQCLVYKTTDLTINEAVSVLKPLLELSNFIFTKAFWYSTLYDLYLDSLSILEEQIMLLGKFIIEKVIANFSTLFGIKIDDINSLKFPQSVFENKYSMYKFQENINLLLNLNRNIDEISQKYGEDIKKYNKMNEEYNNCLKVESYSTCNSNNIFLGENLLRNVINAYEQIEPKLKRFYIQDLITTPKEYLKLTLRENCEKNIKNLMGFGFHTTLKNTNF